MPPEQVAHVDMTRLGTLLEIHRDTRGTVFSVPSVRINRRLPALYKQYHDPAVPAFDQRVLERMVGLLGELDAEEQRWLNARAAWPAAVVTHAGRVTGYLMRQPPEGLRPAAGLLAGAGPPLAEAVVAELHRDLIDLMEWLHEWDVALGTSMPNHLLVNPWGRPRCFLFDCERVRLHDEPLLDRQRAADGGPASEAAATVIDADRAAIDDLISRLAPEIQLAASRPPEPEELGPRRAARPPATVPLQPPGPVEPPPSAPAEQMRGGAGLGTVAGLGTDAAPGDRVRLSDGAGHEAPERRSAGIGRWLVASSALAVLLVIGTIMLVWARRPGTEPVAVPAITATRVTTAPNPQPVTTVSTRPPPSSTPPSSPATKVGLVDIGAVQNDPRAPDIGAMFDIYFSAINNRDYDRALSVYDPSGNVDPNNPAHRQAFIDGVSTTTDSDASVLSIGGDGTATTARLTFQSTQQAGKGPIPRPQETCTRWDVTYVLSSPAQGQYRILRAAQAQNRPC
jgi:hypothetical protein